jgi:surface antigen
MNRVINFVGAVCALLLSAVPTTASASRYLQCVPFARAQSGIEIRGNAKTWWGQAAGRYERGSTPREGSVMAFPGIRKMPLGHVATVSRIVSDREVLLTHANWSRRGGIERNVRAVDVSDAGDWSRVRVWFAGNGDLGTTSYPVSGFIYASGTPRPVVQPKPIFAARGPLLSDDIILMARVESGTTGGQSGVAMLR